MTKTQITKILNGRQIHVERGNARGEWVVANVSCWTLDDVRRAIAIRPLDYHESYDAVTAVEDRAGALGIPAAPYFPAVLEAR